MEIRLSSVGERKLKDSLIETLQKQSEELWEALHAKDLKRVQQIGHSLRGNSGALYFRLTEIKEIGIGLQVTSHLERDKLERAIQQLRAAIQTLQE